MYFNTNMGSCEQRSSKRLFPPLYLVISRYIVDSNRTPWKHTHHQYWYMLKCVQWQILHALVKLFSFTSYHGSLLLVRIVDRFTVILCAHQHSYMSHETVVKIYIMSYNCLFRQLYLHQVYIWISPLSHVNEWNILVQ